MRIINAISSSLGLIWLAAKRLRSAPELTIALVGGLTTIVALVAGVPAFVEAANNRVLRQQLRSMDLRRGTALTFYYQLSTLAGTTIRFEDLQAADAYLKTQAGPLLDLPVVRTGLFVHSDLFSLFPSSEAYKEASQRRAITAMQVGFVRDLEQYVVLVEGRFPQVVSPDQPIEVLITEGQANRIGLHVGEEFVLFRREEQFAGKTIKRFEDHVRVTGIWRSKDEKDIFWYLAPNTYDEILLMPEESYIRRIISDQPYSLTYAGWQQVFDARSLQASQVARLLGRIGRLQTQLAMRLPGITCPLNPVYALKVYQNSVTLQTRILLTFGLPLFVLVLSYVIFVSSLAVRQQALEIALMRSRGMTKQQLLLLYLFQALILGLIALGVGLFLARYVAQAIGFTRSFLGGFANQGPLEIRITTQGLWLSILAIALALLSCVLPAFRWAQMTIVTFKHYLARLTESPWWRRYYLDLVLLGISAYGYYVLRKQGNLPFLLGGAGDPFQNPLLILAPTLFVLATGLVFIRIFPLVMSFLHWASRSLPGTVFLLSSGRLARSSAYNSVLLLLLFTISLSVFTGSLAQTLDTSLVQQAYYRVGADLALQELSWGGEGEGSGGGFAWQKSAATQPIGGASTYLPAKEAEQVPGVKKATRVSSLSVRSTLGEQGTMLGVDRLSLPEVVFQRADFAPRPLGALMNELAVETKAALVNTDFLARHNLQIGDMLTVLVNNPESTKIDLKIAGVFNLFPTFYPGNQGRTFLVIGNAEYIEQALGYPLTGQLWLRVDSAVSTTDVITGVKSIGFQISAHESALDQIWTEQQRIERVGLFGFLSVGFTIVSFLSMFCLLIYVFVSLRQWGIQFGILRAMGLTANQLVGVVVLEQSLLVIVGMLIGAGLGIWMSYLFLPFLQVSYAQQLPLPPLVVEIAWQGVWRVYGLIGLALVITMLGMIHPLRRIRVFEAIKMGEAQSL